MFFFSNSELKWPPWQSALPINHKSESSKVLQMCVNWLALQLEDVFLDLRFGRL